MVPAGRGAYPTGIMPRREPIGTMPLPKLKEINWVTTDCYGTLIDSEKGILDGFSKEAERDGFSFDEQKLIDRFLEVQAEIMGGSYELYAEVLRRTAVKVAGEIGWELEPSRAQFVPDSVARWLPFREANAAMDRLGKRYQLGIISNIDDKLLGVSRGTFAPISTSSSPHSRCAATSPTRPTSRRGRGGSAARRAGCTSAAAMTPTWRRC